MQESPNFSLDKSYSKVIRYAKSHYENFPVISFLIPRELRKHIAIIYWFARTADDFADEGTFSEGERLEKLNEFELSFKNLLGGKICDEYELALSNTIKEKNLSPSYFYNLLAAFKQDAVKKRYENFEEVLSYCKNSANPVGRLILELFDIRNNEANEYSDNICTALQLTNFLQDITIDYKKGRIYLPQDEIENFAVTEKLFEQKENNHNLKQLVQYNIERVQSLFDNGKKLLPLLQGRLKAEIGWTVSGGEEILEKIRMNDYDVFSHRPKLTKIKMAVIFIKSLGKS
jgi:squalene synthase HpnC